VAFVDATDGPFVGESPDDPQVATTNGYLDMESHMGMDQYLLIPFLMG
jgi:hypothetical protein